MLDEVTPAASGSWCWVLSNPHTLTSRSNLAVDYRAVGRYEEAFVLDEATLAASEKVLGPEHPLTLRRRLSLEVARAATTRSPSSRA